jgi:glutathione S-transferase
MAHLRRSDTVQVVVLYVCPFGTSFGDLPAPIAHPCGRAAKALDDAGYTYDVKQVKGGSAMFWTWPARARDRAEVERLSGRRAVPILVLDSGEVVTGSGAIARWAQEHPAKSPAAAA